MAEKRLAQELRKINTDPPPGISAKLTSDDNVFEWNAMIYGPRGTPYEGGMFRIRMNFPPSYPTHPPKVSFYSKMFHPNVYRNGNICLDIIQNWNKWKPTYDAATVLFAIQVMLGDPNVKSPANSDANKSFQDDLPAFESSVKKIVQQSLDYNRDDFQNENV